MALLTKDQILKAEDLKCEIIDVPEWGGQVKICTTSGYARDRLEMTMSNDGGKLNTDNIRARYAAATIIDDDGNLLFDESDILKLGKKSSAALDRVFEAVQKLNLLSDKDVENLAKNS